MQSFGQDSSETSPSGYWNQHQGQVVVWRITEMNRSVGEAEEEVLISCCPRSQARDTIYRSSYSPTLWFYKKMRRKGKKKRQKSSSPPLAQSACQRARKEIELFCAPAPIPSTHAQRCLLAHRIQRRLPSLGPRTTRPTPPLGQNPNSNSNSPKVPPAWARLDSEIRTSSSQRP